ncbi:unnamed protein product [Rotaria socialis]|uniref:Uncharacterized protein n=1 Tax=Rotaria socialis TaxID=392032 RepID=A0A817RXV7_9BILA|nr:unnamed protein product [Rotaria socialis]CAF3477234.1 unnamed protein product [Rotaria socialis]CAF3526062.1 unnamed protein product [Rotaria socialis]CAF4395018.1 unnamed protein product [Rotaria socialis]CAF4418299.1 unnamed protein product [Rotaria socialis]
MLDDTPCLPDIEQVINRYFPELKNKFSMLLTYHPTIDCEHGRYLLLNNASGSHVFHGTGSKLMWYLGVLNVAYKLNLTLVHLDWVAEHSGDETNVDREKYWQFFDWEIPYSAYHACPQNSSVKRNIFRYDLIANQTFDQHHNGKQPFTIKSYFKTRFDQFIATLQNNSSSSNNNINNNIGFTFYSSRTFTIISSLMEVGVVFEIRWWCQHRKLYNKHTGVWSGVSILSNYLPTDYFQYIAPSTILTNNSIAISETDKNINIDVFKSIQCAPIYARDVFLIGVHIRHGDVVKRDNQSRIISGDLYRYMSNSAYTPLLIYIINALPTQIRNKYLITIYSEGVINDFHDILISLKKAFPESRCRISFFLNGRTSETFNRFLRDDILIGSLSTFSMAAGIFNSRQLKLGPKHNRARVHGMRNHLSLDLDVNHTNFKITAEKQQLIKQRIQYVWNQKQAQQKTAIPLWLDNYSSDYPETYMLI